MDNKSYKRIIISRPKDRSIEAYKAWMMELAKQLSSEENEIKWTEEEWIANWEKFWREKETSRPYDSV
jgi:hypothetical protein